MSRFEELLPHELALVLPRVLAGPDGVPAGAPQVAGFRAYLEESGLEWWGLRSGPATSPAALLVALRPPGGTALAMIPAPGLRGIVPAAQLGLTGAALEVLRARRLHYVQALVESATGARAGLLLEAGFRLLTTLLYLERDARYPWVEPPGPDEAAWVAYTPERHALFAEVVAATYRDSRDCPELTGLRPVDDALAAHRATGRFDPALWEVAMYAGRPAGCLLLGDVSTAALLDVVYMGVVPEFRQRGIGALLLRRALAQCRERRIRRLTVVVDERNGPARRLYERYALRQVAQRTALLYRWS